MRCGAYTLASVLAPRPAREKNLLSHRRHRVYDCIYTHRTHASQQKLSAVTRKNARTYANILLNACRKKTRAQTNIKMELKEPNKSFI